MGDIGDAIAGRIFWMLVIAVCGGLALGYGTTFISCGAEVDEVLEARNELCAWHCADKAPKGVVLEGRYTNNGGGCVCLKTVE